MPNGPEVNTEFEKRVLKLLEQIGQEQRSTISNILHKVEKIEDREERDIKEINSRLSDIEKQDISQSGKLQTQEDKIKDINTLVRWAGLLIVGAVLMALLNMVVISNKSLPVPSNAPVLQQSLYRDEQRRFQPDSSDVIHISELIDE